MTARFKQALRMIDVRLLDDVVVAGGDTAGLAERGWG